MNLLKKGAMFGLDARIALAIFGALSVISGASLYSAIQNSKATAIYVSLKELLKASDSYHLDTGYYLSGTTDSRMLETSDLIDNHLGLPGWSGPYLTGTLSSIDVRRLEGSILSYDSVIVIMWQWAYDDWPTNMSSSPSYCSVATKGCYEWSNIVAKTDKNAVPFAILAQMVDEMYDDGIFNTGDVRWSQANVGSSSHSATIYLKGKLRGSNGIF